MKLIEDLNNFRHNLHLHSHSDKENDVAKKIGSWLGHKAVTLISLPVHALELGGSLAGFAASACTIGAAKIAVFAATLGNVDLPVSVGFGFFAEHAFEGLKGLFSNTGELIYDALDLVEQTARLPGFVAKKLGLDGALKEALHRISEVAVSCLNQVNKALDFCYKRFVAGCEKACESENPVKVGTPYPLDHLNKLTSDVRINFKSNDRSMADIFKHYV